MAEGFFLVCMLLWKNCAVYYSSFAVCLIMSVCLNEQKMLNIEHCRTIALFSHKQTLRMCFNICLMLNQGKVWKVCVAYLCGIDNVVFS